MSTSRTGWREYGFPVPWIPYIIRPNISFTINSDTGSVQQTIISSLHDQKFCGFACFLRPTYVWPVPWSLFLIARYKEDFICRPGTILWEFGVHRKLSDFIFSLLSGVSHLRSLLPLTIPINFRVNNFELAFRAHRAPTLLGTVCCELFRVLYCFAVVGVPHLRVNNFT